MERLNDDLITEIFARLPVKSIVRASCVNKSWNKLISEDHRERKRLRQPLAGFIYQLHQPSYSYNTDFGQLRNKSSCYNAVIKQPDFSSFTMTILHVCNGLVLCCDRERSNFVVYNPATGKWNNIRRLPAERKLDMLAVGFNPSISPHYKVLGFDDRDKKLKIFQSETDNWEDCTGDWEEYCPGDSIPCPLSSVFLDGVFYVICKVKRLICQGTSWVRRRRMNVFAVTETCQLKRIQLPCQVSDINWIQHIIGISDGFLHLAIVSFGLEMLVFSMEGYDKWVLKHLVHMCHLWMKVGVYSHYSSTEHLWMLAFHTDMDVILLYSPPRIISYNFKNGTLERIFQKLDGYGGLYQFHPFSPCLIDDA